MYSDPHDIVKDFPTAKPTVKRLIKEKTSYLDGLQEEREDIKMHIFDSLTPHEINNVGERLDRIIDLYQTEKTRGGNMRTQDELDLLTRLLKVYQPIILDPTKPNEGVTAEQIVSAKLYPIKELVKVNRAHKAICPFHADTHASLHVYTDNRAHCFVCEWNGDVIDMYMKMNGVEFIPAVKALL